MPRFSVESLSTERIVQQSRTDFRCDPPSTCAADAFRPESEEGQSNGRRMINCVSILFPQATRNSHTL